MRIITDGRFFRNKRTRLLVEVGRGKLGELDTEDGRRIDLQIVAPTAGTAVEPEDNPGVRDREVEVHVGAPCALEGVVYPLVTAGTVGPNKHRTHTITADIHGVRSPIFADRAQNQKGGHVCGISRCHHGILQKSE